MSKGIKGLPVITIHLDKIAKLGLQGIADKKGLQLIPYCRMVLLQALRDEQKQFLYYSLWLCYNKRMKKRSKIDFAQLAKEIQEMSPRHKLWKVLSTELKKIGRWRVKGRGDPQKGWVMRGTKSQKEQ